MHARRRSRSATVGGVVALVGVLLILTACYGLAAIGESRSGSESSRAAAGADYSTETMVRLTVSNATSNDVVVNAIEVNASDWTGLGPNDATAFANRTIAARGSSGVDLEFSTLRSRTPFGLEISSSTGTKVGTLNLDRDYLKPTCTKITQGSYTIDDCTQVNVWWLADARILGTSSSCPSSKNSREIGEYVDAAGAKQKVKATLSCSSSTGATTVTISQSAVTGS